MPPTPEQRAREAIDALLLDSVSSACSGGDALVLVSLLQVAGWPAAIAGRGAGVGRPNLNAPSIEAIPIPMPPLEEQAVILERIESTMALMEKLATEFGQAAASGRALRQSVLGAAFSGVLVPQCDSDEPASALLARIAAEPPPTPARRRS